MMRVARLACLIFIAVPLLVAPATAQSPAVHQYTDPGRAIKGTSTSGTNAAPGASTSGTSAAPGAGTSGRPAGGSSSGTGTPAGAPPPTLRLVFGAPDDRLDDAIDAALMQGGMPPSLPAQVKKARLVSFLDGRLADELGDGDPEAVGRAVAQLVVDPGPQTPEVLAALLGNVPQTGPATHAIFTRSSVAKGDSAQFQRGLVKGSSGVSRAYVEMSSSATSFVGPFDALGVPTVDNLDTAAGRAALVAILVSGAEGNFGAKQSADSKLVDGEVRPMSAVTRGSFDPRVGYVLVLVVVAFLWSVLGLRPRRVRRAD